MATQNQVDELESRVMQAWQSPIRFSLDEVGEILKYEIGKEPRPYDPDVCKCVLMVGECGVGKSRRFVQICNEIQAEAVKHHHGATIAEDNHGNPEIIGHETKHALAAHCIPFMRPPNSKTKRGAWLIDETMSGQTKEHETFLRMVIDRKLDEYDMHEGWTLIGATNPPTAKYTTVRECDGSLEDRFIILPVDVPTEARLSYWSNCMGSTIYKFLLLNWAGDKHTNLVTAHSSRKWSNLADSVELYKKGGASRNLIVKVVQAQMGAPIASMFGAFLENGDNPDKYPMRAHEIFDAEASELQLLFGRLGRWMEKKSDKAGKCTDETALIGATKFDVTAYLEDEKMVAKLTDKAVHNLADFMVFIGSNGFSDMVDDVFCVMRQTPLMKRLLDKIRGTALEKKLIQLLETSKKSRFAQIKNA